MSKKNNNQIGLKFAVVLISILSYIAYLMILFNTNNSGDYSNYIVILSWIGIAIGVYVVISWYKLTGNLFSLYTIFMLFFFLFNYGQPLMWAFGIHQSREIGQVGLYTLGAPNSAEIISSQSIILVSIVLFHFGAIYSYKGKFKGSTTQNIAQVSNLKSQISRIAIYKTSFYLSLISIPITFYNVIYKLFISQTYGYRSFYYNDEVVTSIVAFNLIDNLFFPCLVGLLIGSNYKKNNRVFVYTIFFLYVILSILSGDRGNWVIKLIILIWMNHTYYRKINSRKFMKYILVGTLGVQILDAVVSVRNIGINLNNIIQSFSFNESAIISAIFEMGGSMRPTVVLMKYGWDIWPYGNTYVNAALGIITSRTMTIIGRPWAPLSDWFSQTYLGIPYGAGFSIVAEALINFGPLVAPLFMIVLGFMISSLTYLDRRNSISNNPMKIFFSITTMSFLVGVIRNHFLWITKSWFYGVVVFMVLIILVREYIKSKSYFRGSKYMKGEVEKL